MEMQDKDVLEEKKEYLKQYKKIYYKIKSLEEQKKSLMESMRSAQSIEYSDMPKGNKQSDLSDYIVKLDNLINTIDRKRRELEHRRIDIECSIIKMEDGIECDLLRKKYIELKPWEAICMEMDYSWRQIHRYHSSALINFNIT